MVAAQVSDQNEDQKRAKRYLLNIQLLILFIVIRSPVGALRIRVVTLFTSIYQYSQQSHGR